MHAEAGDSVRVTPHRTAARAGAITAARAG
jgi:hypothetical protein